MDGREEARRGIDAEVVGCARKGMGTAELACRLGWSRAGLQSVGVRQEDLGQALERAHDAALAWWEGRARLWAARGQGNASLWSRAMAGRFADDGYGAPGRALARSKSPTPPKREWTLRDRAKAVLLLLAEAEKEKEKERESQGNC